LEHCASNASGGQTEIEALIEGPLCTAAHLLAQSGDATTASQDAPADNEGGVIGFVSGSIDSGVQEGKAALAAVSRPLVVLVALVAIVLVVHSASSSHILADRRALHCSLNLHAACRSAPLPLPAVSRCVSPQRFD
jgi:hypothetical protein